MIRHSLVAGAALALAACGSRRALPPAAGFGADSELPEPRQGLLPTIKIAPAVGWPAGATPAAAPGFTVTVVASALDNPRWLYRLPNGDIPVAERTAPPSAARNSLLRDADGEGSAEATTAFLEDRTSPFGMALIGDRLHGPNADALVVLPDLPGQTVNAGRARRGPGARLRPRRPHRLAGPDLRRGRELSGGLPRWGLQLYAEGEALGRPLGDQEGSAPTCAWRSSAGRCRPSSTAR